VLPFKTGAGVRIKGLTALQHGIPIVSTSLGVEGLRVKDKKEYLLAENERDFAKCVIKFLINQKLRDTMSKQQTLYFENNHSLDKNSLYLKKYQELYSATLKIL
jgi:glycosyltransferase involved in cell wall biosynthesis